MCVEDPFDGPFNPLPFSFRSNFFRSRTGRLTSNVEEVRSSLKHARSMGNRLLLRLGATSREKRIWRTVHNPHYPGCLQRQGALLVLELINR